MKFNYIYDEQSDVLSIFNNSSKPKESIGFSENIIFDINNEGHLVAIQILEASEFFNSINNLINKDFLINLEGVELTEKEYRNNWFVVIGFKSKGLTLVQQPMPLLRKAEYKSPLMYA